MLEAMVASKIIKEIKLGAEFNNFIKSVGECKSKAEEDRIVAHEVMELKRRLEDPRIDKSRMKEYMLRAMYVEMLG